MRLLGFFFICSAFVRHQRTRFWKFSHSCSQESFSAHRAEPIRILADDDAVKQTEVEQSCSIADLGGHFSVLRTGAGTSRRMVVDDDERCGGQQKSSLQQHSHVKGGMRHSALGHLHHGEHAVCRVKVHGIQQFPVADVLVHFGKSSDQPCDVFRSADPAALRVLDTVPVGEAHLAHFAGHRHHRSVFRCSLHS